MRGYPPESRRAANSSLTMTFTNRLMTRSLHPRTALRTTRAKHASSKCSASTPWLKSRLLKLRDFDENWLDELLDCAQKLSEEGPQQPRRTADPKIDLRNRMLTLLDRRVSKVRCAAQHIYEEHPEMVRLVTSAYERRKRLEAKRKKKG